MVAALVQAGWCCEEIAVLSHDAKYMLLDGDTLETLDVGNLRWQGVWAINGVLPGSTSQRLAFTSDRLTGEAANPTRDRYDALALVVVENLAEAKGTRGAPMTMSFSREYMPPVGHRSKTWWIDGTDQLLVWSRRASRVEATPSKFTVVDRRLRRIDEWTVAEDVRDPMMACRDRGRLYVGAGGHLVVRHEGASVVEAIAVPEGAADCRVERLSLGCLASVGCRVDGQYEKAFVDVASNRVVSRMPFDNSAHNVTNDRLGPADRAYMRSVALFAGGGKLLGQPEIWRAVPPDLNSFRTNPGALLRVLNTANGATVVVDDQAPSGNVSRVFRRGGHERVVLSGDGRVHLLDLGTLEVIATAAIPFGRHFVF